MAQVTNMTDVPFRDMMQDGLVGRRKGFNAHRV